MTMEESDVKTRGFSLFGVRFAPLLVPWKRRMQLLAIMKYVLCFLLLGFGNLFFFIYLLFTDYYWIPLVYAGWFLYDYSTPFHGSRSNEWLRKMKIWKHMRDYFPISLVKTCELDPSKNYIMATHPHGILCFGVFNIFATDAHEVKEVFPGMRPFLLALTGQFWFPLYREYVMCGAVCSCSKESIRWLLTNEGTGKMLVLLTGGAAEVFEATPDNTKVVLKNHKGFCKLALENGADLVPCYVFGETSVYEQLPVPMQRKLKRFTGFAPCLFKGRGIFNYSFGILPQRKPITTVVGKPLGVEKVSNPSREQIDSVHTKYVSALVDLFETHKIKYGYSEENHLEII